MDGHTARRTGKKLAGFALLAAAMGALQWNWFAMPLERDEGEYAYAAWLMRTGKGVPYRDSFLQKPPMIVYTYGAVEAIAPGSDKAGFRVAGFLAALATAGLVWRLGEREFGGRAGWWGAWMWAFFLQQSTMFSSAAANVEKFMVAPMLGAMAVAGAGERRGWRWGLAGALAGAAALYKPICVPVLVVWFLWAVFARQGQTMGGRSPAPPGAAESRTPQSVWWRVGWVVLGGVAAAAAGTVWFAWKGALGELWECAVAYTGEYAKLTGHPWSRGTAWLADAGHWKAWLMLGLAAAGFCRRDRRGWGWGALLAAAWGVAMADANGHYYVMALPLAAVGAGAGIDRIAGGRGRGAGWAGAACAAAVAAAMMSGNEGWALRCTPRQLVAGMYHGNPFVEAEGAGKILAELCGEGETAWVVGSEPEILWYARRKGATRFDIAYPLTLPTGRAAGYLDEAAAALGGERPAAVVVATTPLGVMGDPRLRNRYGRLAVETIEKGGYRLAWAFVPDGGGWKADGAWEERLGAGASLGVFAKAEVKGRRE